MDPTYIEDWLPGLIAEELSFLEQEHGFRFETVDPGYNAVVGRFSKPEMAFEVRVEYMEGILSTPFILAAQAGQPNIELELNMILEARGRKDLWITQDDVGEGLDGARARILLRQVATNVRVYASDVLAGDLSVAYEIQRLLADFRGDPRFDWWLNELPER